MQVGRNDPTLLHLGAFTPYRFTNRALRTVPASVRPSKGLPSAGTLRAVPFVDLNSPRPHQRQEVQNLPLRGL